MNDNSQLTKLASDAALLAKSLPTTVVKSVASVLSSVEADWQNCKTLVLTGIAHPHYRSIVLKFLDDWMKHAEDVVPQAVAAAVLAAACSERNHRDSHSVELVWTGPDVGVVSFRRTEQALLQVIDAAAFRVLVVSYAVYNIPRICDALVRAAGRGVRITVVVETPNRLEGQNTYSTLQALGPEVAAKSDVYYWPLENRQKDANGRAGILHVKCAVADGRTLFLTSANLTEYAFTVNMELGLLVAGGNLPEQIENHFDRMIEIGILATP